MGVEVGLNKHVQSMVEGTGCAGHGEGPGIWHVRVWGGRRGLPTHHLPSSCEKASTVAAQLCAQKRQSDSASKHQSDKERQSIKVAKWQSGKAPTACASDTPAKHCTRAECNTVGHQSSGESSVHRQGASACRVRSEGRCVPPKYQSGKVAKWQSAHGLRKQHTAEHCTRAECNTVGHQSSGESSAQARRREWMLYGAKGKGTCASRRRFEPS